MSNTRSPAEVVARSSPIAATAPLVARELERDESANSHAVALREPSKSVFLPPLRQLALRVPGFGGAIAANLRIQPPKP